MDRIEIYEKLTTVFRDVFDDDSLVLTPETTAEDIQGWDSSNHISIIMATEAAFGIRFKSAEIDQLKNVGEFVGIVEGKLPK